MFKRMKRWFQIASNKCSLVESFSWRLLKGQIDFLFSTKSEIINLEILKSGERREFCKLKKGKKDDCLESLRINICGIGN